MELRDEEQFVTDRLRPYEIDFTRGLIGLSRKKIYVDNDVHIKNLVVAYDNHT